MSAPKGTAEGDTGIRRGGLDEELFEADIVKKTFVGVNVESHPARNTKIILISHCFDFFTPGNHYLLQYFLNGVGRCRVIILRQLVFFPSPALFQNNVGEKILFGDKRRARTSGP